MDALNIDYANPFLYLAGISTVSVLTNIYCCFRRYKHNNRKEQEANIELTTDFKTIIQDVNERIVSPEMKDQETVIDVKIIDETKKNEATTQTEDCQLYEMMGARFNEELDFYKNAVINKHKNKNKNKNNV